MRTAAAFNRIVHQQLARHAAWVPTVSPFSLGDYGFFHGGTFQRIGNIQSLGVQFSEIEGGTASLVFRSESGLTVKFFVEGRGQVPQLPVGDVEARIEYHYERAQSFVLNLPRLSSVAIDDVASMARRVAELPSWRFRRYKIITELLSAKEATLLATASRNSTLAVSGKASLLKDFHGGKVGGGVTVESNQRLALDIVGADGPVAFGLVRALRGGGLGLESTKSVEVDYVEEAPDPLVDPDDDF